MQCFFGFKSILHLLLCRTNQPAKDSREKKTFSCHVCTARIPVSDKDSHTNGVDLIVLGKYVI